MQNFNLDKFFDDFEKTVESMCKANESMKKAREVLKSKEVIPVPDDFEILTCKNRFAEGVHDFIPPSTTDRISNCIDDKCEIFSIKRLSDSVVFSVGDETNHGKITGFDILGGSRMHVYSLPQNATELKDISKLPIKPPLGIIPEFIFLENRLKEITEAIDRYMAAHLCNPKEWEDEYKSIIDRLRELQNQSKIKL